MLNQIVIVGLFRVGLRFGLRVEVMATGRVMVSVGDWVSVRVTVAFRVRVNVRPWAMTIRKEFRLGLGLS